MNVQQFFNMGMKRFIPDIIDAPPGLVVNLGAGNSPIEGAINLDHPNWNAENYLIEIPARERHFLQHPTRAYPLPADAGDIYVTAPDESIACVHAYHFLEHVHNPLRMLMEINRVLKPGGVANICVPHFSGAMAHQDLDHKHTFALETWDNALKCKYYTKDRQGWRLKIGFNVMMALVERNTCILTQLIKE